MVSLHMKSLSFVLCLFSFAIATEANVHMSHKWKPNEGWEVTCSWDLATDNHLLSVDLYKNYEQIANYEPAPEYDSIHRIVPTENDDTELTCKESDAKCTLMIKPKLPPKRKIIIICKLMTKLTNGPTMQTIMESLAIGAFVPPSDAVLDVSKTVENSHKVLNCSATGIPAPKFEWTVGDDETQVSESHYSKEWNSTSKLWHAWSTFMPTSDQHPVRCTAKVVKDHTQHTSYTAKYP